MPKILISIILFGLSIFLGVIFLWPQYQELHNLQLKIQNIDLDIRYEEEYYEELSFISKQIDDYQKEISNIDSALPFNPSKPSLLRFLQKITSENGLILTNVGSFSVKPLSVEANTKEIQTSLGLVGSYPAFKNFLAVLEKSARLIEIDNISFSTSRFLPVPGVPGEAESEIPSDIFSFQLNIRTNSY